MAMASASASSMLVPPRALKPWTNFTALALTPRSAVTSSVERRSVLVENRITLSLSFGCRFSMQYMSACLAWTIFSPFMDPEVSRTKTMSFASLSAAVSGAVTRAMK